MKSDKLAGYYSTSGQVEHIGGILSDYVNSGVRGKINLKGLCGSSPAFVMAALFRKIPVVNLITCNQKEDAAYLFNDLELLAGRENVLFFPTTYRKTFAPEERDPANIQIRTQALAALTGNPVESRFAGRQIPAHTALCADPSSIPQENRKPVMIVTYPEALSEKTAPHKTVSENSWRLKTGEKYGIDFITDLLSEYGFERHDFIFEPGQYSVRGGIIDIFSLSSEHPYRIEFVNDTVESIRIFEPSSQYSIRKTDEALIIQDPDKLESSGNFESIFSYLPPTSLLWYGNYPHTAGKIADGFNRISAEEKKKRYLSKEEFFLQTDNLFRLNLSGFVADEGTVISFNTTPQPSFNKNFSLLLENMTANIKSGIKNFLLSDNPKQIDRFYDIFDDLSPEPKQDETSPGDIFTALLLPIKEGFTDHDLKICCYTDHQIFNRYHRYHLKEGFRKTKNTLVTRDLMQLKPGDYVVHIDHGIGRFGGLEKIEVNGKIQEAVKIFYRDNDVLFISIHSLHRIARYGSKDGSVPRIDKLGSDKWNKLKQKTKKKIKELAFDLIKLYARRKMEKGFAFMPDTYLQTELEASFIYEDTPDQIKTTADVKKDMENESPMDRLICGDVGFGKTEIAVRAAFKAVADNKQAALLAPTTILALQHFKTFSERLADFPCNLEYLNRFKKISEQKEILRKLEDGKIDIIIGTHALLGKNVRFRDLGILIIDEEQKFGVSAKERLKTFKTNVDTLTLSATPIPRTLQLSLLGARDMSVIHTPPPNRYPVETEVHEFNQTLIRNAITYEVDRGGQVFFIHNRIENIDHVAGIIQRVCPGTRIGVAHGRMKGRDLEKIMLDFIEDRFDVLICTTIIESGIDIPNVNTIIINDAQNFGISDLHQMRGRVGRSNKKAFCYLLTQPAVTLSDEAKKRLKAIEDFSDLGSGFNIAMRDLDIRGAGNMLGAEQSGFINDMGYETYQKIIDEAVMEIKTEMNNNVEKPAPAYAHHPDLLFAKECQVDTDLEILIPDDYIESISERLSVYRELSEIKSEEKLNSFITGITDRFGPLPDQARELFNIILLRNESQEAGIEKIIMRSGRFLAYFPSGMESPFFLKEKNNRLILVIPRVTSVGQAMNLVRFLNIDEKTSQNVILSHRGDDNAL
ncbi:MAG: transcription-repair coupling factor [Bacteroidetes bacterium]|nr:transcription-repair coupling factor [Bacteroidota bacterium]